ncbi:MAG: SUMF1/EgtB/PvdO family nonheme iron enzyme [Isosphaeraceae bacterium]
MNEIQRLRGAPVLVRNVDGRWKVSVVTGKASRRSWLGMSLGLNLWEQRAKDPDQPRPVGDGTMRDHVGEGPDHPIYFVSHAEAEEFCRGMTESERTAGWLAARWEYRLPTEAQWEYACRAGTNSATPFGDRLGSAEANFDGTRPYYGAPQGPFLRETTPVGRYRGKAWGLHDMLGTVWEWCRDGYAPRLAGGVDPRGPSAAPERVFGMVQKRRFSGNTRNFSADPDRSRVGAGFRESLAAVLGLQFRENRVYPRSSSQ